MFTYTNNFLPVLIVILVLAVVAERTGLINWLLQQLASFTYWSIKWLFSIEGSWGSLPEKLAYRDFWDDIVETKNGWFWVGVEVVPFPTDGLSNKEKNRLATSINNFYTILPPNTRIQHISKINTDASVANDVFHRIVKANPKSVFTPLQIARRNWLLRAGHKGEIKTTKVYIFFGRQASEIALERGWIKAGIKYVQSIYNPKPFLDIERAEFLRVKEELLRIRETVGNNIKAVWGTGDVVRNLSAKEIFQLAWTKLNPEIAEHHPAPDYPNTFTFQFDNDFTNSTNLANSAKINNLTNPTYVNNTNNKLAKANNTSKYIDDEPLITYPILLIDNPRQVLCQTNVRVEKDYFLFDDRFCMTLSMAKYPSSAYALMAENLYRDPLINFPIEVATHYTPENKAHRDHKLAKKQNWLRASMRRSNNNPDVVENVQNDQYSAIRHILNTENQAIGEFGFSITFWAKTKSDLYRYRDLVVSTVQGMGGCRVSAERHCGLDLHLTTLPCTPHGVPGDSTGDFRRRLALSRDALAFTPWTGAPRGVPVEEAFDILQGREGNLLPWGTDPRYRRFRNGMKVIIGKSGSGKSAFLNKLRISWLSAGRIGVSIDYQNSAVRVARAVDGIVIDVSKPAQTKGLGLFAIRPRQGEYFEPDELTKDGLPKDRLLAVVEMLEIFCLDDPTKPQTRLEPEMVSILSNAVNLTYARLLNQIPIIDDFIVTLRRIPGKDNDIGRKLAARLELFAKDSGLGYWLNDRSEPLPVDRYTVFDLGYVTNVRLRLVILLALIQHLDRFIHNNPAIAKFVDIDEVGELCKDSGLSKIIDRLVRTARKKNSVVTLSSQAPTDFDNDDLKGILSNCEIKYLFELNDAEKAAEVLKLTAGQYRAIKTLKPATKDFSEFLLTYPSPAPGGGSAVIRMKYCPVEGRLAAGAGYELFTYDQAFKDLQATKLPIHPSLVAALQMDALTGTNRQKTVAVAS